MKHLFLTAALTTICTLPCMNIYAAAPLCPSVAAIQAEGFVQGRSKLRNYILSDTSAYGTHQTWEFGLFLENRFENENDAIAVGNTLLKTMVIFSYNGRATKSREGNKWICTYLTKEGAFWATATTPMSDSQ